jgi:hypothetical protein
MVSIKKNYIADSQGLWAEVRAASRSVQNWPGWKRGVVETGRVSSDDHSIHISESNTEIPSIFMVTEGSMGYYNYHLSLIDKPCRSLCGKNTMRTSIPLSGYESPGGEHLVPRPTWCTECKDIANSTQK